MKCLIIAAGYATRLYPLTENFPKPLLKVGDKAILDWLIEDLNKTALIDEYVVVTNHKFAPIFNDWAGIAGQAGRLPVVADNDADRHARPDRASHAPIRIVDDGTSSNDTRLGAVRDMDLGIKTCNIDDDLLVMAGDNLLSFSLAGFVDYFAEKGTTCIMRYYEPDKSRLHKSGVAEVDAEGRILSMEEKPAEPKANWCCPPFYIIKKEDLPLVNKAIASGCGVDAPGSFIAWLCQQVPVHAWEMPGRRYDIGNLESYEEVKQIFAVIPSEAQESKQENN